MSDVFVSYKAEDRRRVRPLVEALQTDGLSVWWDEQIGGGSAWRHAIEAELNAAKCVIVIWSKRSVGPEGEFVQDEAARAKERHVYIPVTIDNVHLPLGFGETQALPLSGWRGNKEDAKYKAVVAAVHKNVGGKRRAASSRVSRAHFDRRMVIAGASATVAVGLGGWALLKQRSAGAASNSIAVLPFENLSGDPKQSYFSDGVAEEIRSALARLGGLTVIGRTSSEAVRSDDAPTAAKKLGVRNILTGSVRESPSTIRISAELIDGRTGADRWSQNYDRSPGDTIRIQTDIAQNVATALSAALGGAARAAIAVGGTQNVIAQKLVLQANSLSNGGMVFAGQTTESSYRNALDLLDQAIMLDPKYADAYAHKADLVDSFANHFGRSAEDLAQARAQALGYAKRAISLAPDLASGHLALANLYRSNLQVGDTQRELDKAIGLAPSDADILRNYSVLLCLEGKADRALALANKALSVDPLNGISYGIKMHVLYYDRRYADAVAVAEHTPKALFVSWIRLGDCLTMLGRADEALRAYERGPLDDPLQLAGEALLAARTGNRAAAFAKMQRMQQLFGAGGSFQYGQIYSQLGQPDDAFANLERAWQIKDPGLVSMKVDPFLDPVRSDRRFVRLVQKVGFPA